MQEIFSKYIQYKKSCQKINEIVLVFLQLTLNIFCTVFIIVTEQVNNGWPKKNRRSMSFHINSFSYTSKYIEYLKVPMPAHQVFTLTR